MTLKQLLKQVIRNVGIKEGDIFAESIIKTSLNKSYLDISKKEPKLKTVTLTAVNNTVTLPSDFESVEIITPSLINGEYRKGLNLLVYTNSDNTQKSFDITYVAVPTLLINDTDVPSLSDKAQYLLLDFASSEYLASVGKLNESQYYMNNYESGKKKLYSSDNTLNTIQDITGW